MAGSQGLSSLRRIMSVIFTQNSFDRVMQKLKVVDGGVGRCVCELKVEQEHCNRGDNLHGGMTATMVDVVSTAALMTTGDGHPGVSVDMNVSYLSAATIGEEVIIDANTLKLGKRLAFLTVDVKKKSDGKLIAQGRHTKYIAA